MAQLLPLPESVSPPAAYPHTKPAKTRLAVDSQLEAKVPALLDLVLGQLKPGSLLAAVRLFGLEGMMAEQMRTSPSQAPAGVKTAGVPPRG